MNFKERISKIMAELEQNMESKKDLEYVKNTFSVLISEFFEETEKITKQSEDKLTHLEEKQRILEEKTAQMQDMLKKIEKDIYVNENYDFEIVCPYCNCEFETELDEVKKEVRCPECNNIIELDWNEGECHDACSCCHGCNEEEIEDEEDDSNSEDDM